MCSGYGDAESPKFFNQSPITDRVFANSQLGGGISYWKSAEFCNSHIFWLVKSDG